MGTHERGRLFYNHTGYVVVGTPREPTSDEQKMYTMKDGEKIMSVQNIIPYAGRKKRSYCVRKEEGLARLTSVTH